MQVPNYECSECGSVYLSPRAAIMCEMRDTDEANTHIRSSN
jgi:uncharacterized OB-fold protein